MGKRCGYTRVLLIALLVTIIQASDPSVPSRLLAITGPVSFRARAGAGLIFVVHQDEFCFNERQNRHRSIGNAI
jgi:hypothetical protein